MDVIFTETVRACLNVGALGFCAVLFVVLWIHVRDDKHVHARVTDLEDWKIISEAHWVTQGIVNVKSKDADDRILMALNSVSVKVDAISTKLEILQDKVTRLETRMDFNDRRKT